MPLGPGSTVGRTTVLAWIAAATVATFAVTTLTIGSGGIVMTEQSAPGTPASGKVAVYAKTDGLLYGKDDAGTETQLSNSASAAGFTLVPKVANETVNNSVTFQDDDTFTFAVSANKMYFARLHVAITSTTTADFKWQFTGPASPTLVYYGYAYTSPASSDMQAGLDNPSTAFSTANAMNTISTNDNIIIYIVLQNGANAGTVTFQWAQNTQTAVDTQVMGGSVMEWKQLD